MGQTHHDGETPEGTNSMRNIMLIMGVVFSMSLSAGVWQPPPPTLSQGLTDDQLRASAVPISLATAPTTPVTGAVTCNAGTGTFTITGGLTDTQLRASAVPISLATAPTTPVTGVFFQATQPVSIASMPSTPVTGPLTDTQLRAVAVPVDGSGATQPVSIASMPSTPVTGVFFQSTQPVSLVSLPALAAGSNVIGHVIVDTAPTTAVTIASMPSTPVTGTFFQATQPSSVADGSDSTLGAKADAKNTATDGTAVTIMQVLKQISASVQAPPSQAVTGVFYQATQPVSIATAPALVASSAVIGHVIVDTAPSTAVTGTFFQSTQPGSIADGSDVTLGAKADAKSTATDGTAVTAMQVLKQISASVQAPPSQAVTIASLPALAAGSAVIGHVVADSGSTTAVTGNVASTVADAANVTLGAKADAKSTATDTTAITAMSVLKEISAMEQAPASRAVTNAGTFAVQATIGAGSAVIGHVVADSGSTTAVTGNVASTIADGADTTLGAKADAKSTATDTTAISVMSVLKEISAMEQAPASRAVTNAGTFATQSTLAAETTKVIGTVNVASAQTIGIAAGSAVIGHVINDAGSAVIGHVIADSGSTTAVTGTVTTAEATTGGNPCQNPQATLVSITGATTSTNATQIIALSGSTKIYICSLTIVGVSGTTPTFSLVQGTGSNCVTGQTTVVQAFSTTANQSYLFSGPVSVGTAGAELCYKDGGTSPVQNYQITYVQQ